MKKRKYGLGGDIGKYMLNNLENSALGMFGLDFYKPKFDTSVMQGISNVSEKVIGGTQKAAMGVASTQIPGLGAAMGAVQGIGKNIQFKRGGIMGTGGTLPINPGDLDKVTRNTLQYDGNAHSNGGIPLQNGAELEKNETVIKPGAIGNENPYALSPNIVITEEAAKMFGLSKSDIGKSIADVSRTVEARKPKSQEKMAVKTNEINKKFALDKLMKANEYLSSQIGDIEQNGEKKPYGGELYPGQRYLSGFNNPNYIEKPGYYPKFNPLAPIGTHEPVNTRLLEDNSLNQVRQIPTGDYYTSAIDKNGIPIYKDMTKSVNLPLNSAKPSMFKYSGSNQFNPYDRDFRNPPDFFSSEGLYRATNGSNAELPNMMDLPPNLFSNGLPKINNQLLPVLNSNSKITDYTGDSTSARSKNINKYESSNENSKNYPDLKLRLEQEVNNSQLQTTDTATGAQRIPRPYQTLLNNLGNPKFNLDKNVLPDDFKDYWRDKYPNEDWSDPDFSQMTPKLWNKPGVQADYMNWLDKKNLVNEPTYQYLPDNEISPVKPYESPLNPYGSSFQPAPPFPIFPIPALIPCFQAACV